MTYEENLIAKATAEQALLSDGWRFRWAPETNYSGVGPRHWARWEHPDGFTVGEVDAGRYMAHEFLKGSIQDAHGQDMEWASAAAAIRHIDSLRSKS